MSARLSSAASLILHLAFLALVSLIAVRTQKISPPPIGMEIEITDLQHALPNLAPSAAEAEDVENGRLEPDDAAHAPSSTGEPRMSQVEPLQAQQPTSALVPTHSLLEPPVPMPIKPASVALPELAPAPVEPLTHPVAAPLSALPGLKSSPRPEVPVAPAPQRLNPSMLHRSLSAAAGKAPRTRLNSAAIGSIVGKAVPKGVAGLSLRDRANLVELIRSQIVPCWNPPIADESSGHVTISIQIKLDLSGAVQGTPSITRVTGRSAANAAYANALAGSVRRAVGRCSPLKLPTELHDAWATVDLNFDPRDVS